MQTQEETTTQVITPDEKLWAMLCHITAFATALIPIPIGGTLIVPLIIWMIRKDDSPFVDRHGRESINFQLSCWLYVVLLFIVTIPLFFIVIGIFLWMVLAPLMLVFWVVCIVIAGIKAYDGQEYTYPLTIRFLDSF